MVGNAVSEILQIARFYISETALLIFENQFQKSLMQISPQLMGKITSETTFSNLKVVFLQLLNIRRFFSWMPPIVGFLSIKKYVVLASMSSSSDVCKSLPSIPDWRGIHLDSSQEEYTCHCVSVIQFYKICNGYQSSSSVRSACASSFSTSSLGLKKSLLKHRKNCECCPVSQLIVR